MKFASVSFRRMAVFGTAFLTSLASASPTISQSCSRTYHSAIAQANRGEKNRALATIGCLLMPNSVGVGISGTDQQLAQALHQAVSVWAAKVIDSPFRYAEGERAEFTVRLVHSIPVGGDLQGQVHCIRRAFWSKSSNRYEVTGTILIRDNVEDRPISEDEEASVIEHELGHVLGLDDDPETGGLMGPFLPGNPVYGPSPEEMQVVESFRKAVRDVYRQLIAS